MAVNENFTGFNVSPYYDDFDDSKKFLRVLFVPGRAVQARELTQLQTIIQRQVQRFGQHIFQEGAMVIPGESAYNESYPYLKLEDQYNSVDVDVENFAGRTILGLTSGCLATVINQESKDENDPNTLFINVQSGARSQAFTGNTTSGSPLISNLSVTNTAGFFFVGARVTGSGIPTGTYITFVDTANGQIRLSANATATATNVALTIFSAAGFSAGETIVAIVPASSGLTARFAVVDSETDFSGKGTAFTVQQGVFFTSGFFVLSDTQTVILSKYSSADSMKVGFNVVRTIITDTDDVSLVDPARGFQNLNAPGAHRLKIDLELTSIDYDSDAGEDFIELAAIKNGRLQRIVNKSEYSELAKTFARRTYDESGNYTVRRFPIQVKEHLKTSTLDGRFTESEGGDASKFVVGLEAGKAYVLGFELETLDTSWLNVNKARTTKGINNGQALADLGLYIDITGVKGTFDITNLSAVQLRDSPAVFDSNNHPVSTSPGSQVGSAKIRHFSLFSGTPGSLTAIYRLWLFDIVMDSGKSFVNDVKFIRQVSTPNAIGNVVLTDEDAILGDPNNYIPIYPLNSTFIEKIRDANDEIDTSFHIRRRFSGTMSGNSITFSASSAEFFLAYSSVNYFLSIKTASGTATSNGYEAGDVVNLGAGGNSVVLSGSPVGSQVVVTVPTISGSEIEMIAVVNLSGSPASSEKTKTLVEDEHEVKSASATVQLAKADIFRLVSVIDNDTTTDVTDRFTLDNGQRDAYYDRGRLLLKAGQTLPTGPLVVTYDYFEHGSGDYFSVDSYTSAIDYDDIPSYVSPTTGETFQLRDCFDFRPRINDAGNGFSVLSELVVPSESISADYSYFLPRIDKVVLDSEGNFFIVEGVPADRPVPPKDIEKAMTLYVLNIPAWTSQAKRDVQIRYVENKRYTMRDIGKLEKRIENLEYYTSLSLLEKNTAELFIDDGLGNNRFKNGFVVDNFRTHLLGNTSLLAYLCSIDPEQGFLRPIFVQDYADLEFSTADSSGYQKTGDLLTLPYTSEDFMSQPFASDSENLNPYSVFPWIGTITLDPPSDQWKDTTTKPELTVSIDNVSSIVNFLNEEARDMTFGARWGNWQTEWTGVQSSELLNTTRNLVGSANEADGSQIWFFQDTTETRVTTQTGQSREGTINTFGLNNVTQNLGNRVVDANLTPFMRERDVIFEAHNLKPNTRVYPFFDDISVADYCTPYDVDGDLTIDSNGDTVLGLPLITDSTGYLKGLFRIPNSDTLRFRVGQKRFRVVDDAADRENFITTRAIADYFAIGLLTTEESTLLSVRVPEVRQEIIQDSRVITRTDIVRQSGDIFDPLAQSFFVTDHPYGIFLSSIDLYFRDSGGTLPCFLEIRSMVNGYPGDKVIPFSRVIKYPDAINVSEDASVATTFTFPSPVYLSPDQQYCFVIGAYNTEYEIYTGRIGDFDLDGNRISVQPNVGSLFKSQNLSTWTADQEADIKFVMRKCVFNTAAAGIVTFVNEDIEPSTLGFNPFDTAVDSLQGVITVRHPNHGMKDGDTVTISGCTEEVNGIPASQINDDHVISASTLDTYQITTVTSATGTGSAGGSGVKASKNILMDVFMPTVEEMIISQTNINWEAKTTSVEGGYDIATSSFGGVVNKANTTLDEPNAILSSINEDEEISGVKSFVLKGHMTSVDSDVSPIIDTKRTGIVGVHNRINNDATDEDTTASGGNAESRWITKIINLDEAANDLHIYFAANIPTEASLRVYYKLIEEHDTTTIYDEVAWTEMELEAGTSFVKDRMTDYVFVTPTEQPFFTSFMMKIVMLSTNSAKVPIIKDFRAIALGT